MPKQKKCIGLIIDFYHGILPHLSLFNGGTKLIQSSVIQLSLIVVGSLLFSGCTMTNFHGGIEPISPDAGNPVFADTVDSLSPTFRWEPDVEDPHTYDLAIWDVGSFAQKGIWPTTAYVPMGNKEPGPQVYLKENIPVAEHTLEVALAPDTLYLWSIRTRLDDKVSDWATYDFHVYWTDTVESGQGWYYLFKTPEMENQ